MWWPWTELRWTWGWQWLGSRLDRYTLWCRAPAQQHSPYGSYPGTGAQQSERTQLKGRRQTSGSTTHRLLFLWVHPKWQPIPYAVHYFWLSGDYIWKGVPFGMHTVSHSWIDQSKGLQHCRASRTDALDCFRALGSYTWKDNVTKWIIFLILGLFCTHSKAWKQDSMLLRQHWLGLGIVLVFLSIWWDGYLGMTFNCLLDVTFLLVIL